MRASTTRRTLSRVLLPACVVLAAPLAWPAAPPPAEQSSASNLLLFEVRLGQAVLADALSAFQYGDDVYLPLGELARLLTIAISTQPAEGRAGGYILSEERSFSLSANDGRVSVGGREEVLDRAQFKLQPDDIYIPSRLLARWLPLDLDIDMSGLVLQVRPREQLPLQASLARRGRGQLSGARRGGPADPGYPRQPTPYALAAVPFIDQTFSAAARRGQPADASYTAYLTGDLLGMQGALYASSSRGKPRPDLRLTLARHDPDAKLLGPLHARSAQLGSVAVPGVAGISFGGASGNGIAIGNRPLQQAASFDRHTLEGDLAPGWDVELFVNNALVGFQQSRADGKYSFADQPLVYGANEFRLVFHGPLGQVRVERQTFLLEQSQVAPGQLHYQAAGHRDPGGQLRAAAQFELGLAGGLSANAGMVQLPLAGIDRRYANLGLRHYWNAFIVDVAAVRADDGGALARAQLKTRVAGLSLSVGRTALRDFSSEVFPAAGDAIKVRDELRIDGVLAPAAGIGLPLSLQVKRDRLASNANNTEAIGRVSAYRYGTALTNALRWQSLYGNRFADGSLQASRRMAGFGIGGQLHYTLRPVRELALASLAIDKKLPAGYMVNLGILHSFQSRKDDISLGLTKRLGRVGVGINGYYSTSGDFGGGIQLFVAMGREPRGATWHSDALPLANSGAASARVFLDKNMNGVMDGADEALRNVAFTVNGGSQPARSNAAGIAYLNRLPPNQPADIGLDSATLEDPQWMPLQKGVRITPRPGKVTEIEFAVIVTGEIDGTAYLAEGGARRAIKDLELELVDAGGKVVVSGRSSSDGYFILSNIPPGDYQLRPADKQLQRLGLAAKGIQRVTIGPEGSILNGRDLVVERAPAAGAPAR